MKLSNRVGGASRLQPLTPPYIVVLGPLHNIEFVLSKYIESGAGFCCNPLILLVGDTGIEPVAPAV